MHYASSHLQRAICECTRRTATQRSKSWRSLSEMWQTNWASFVAVNSCTQDECMHSSLIQLQMASGIVIRKNLWDLCVWLLAYQSHSGWPHQNGIHLYWFTINKYTILLFPPAFACPLWNVNARNVRACAYECSNGLAHQVDSEFISFYFIFSMHKHSRTSQLNKSKNKRREEEEKKTSREMKMKKQQSHWCECFQFATMHFVLCFSHMKFFVLQFCKSEDLFA